MKVDISYNDEFNGIELRFSEKPSPEIIFEVKKKMGFRYSKRQNMWYATRNQQREEFAKNLKAALDNGEAPEAISIQVEPSNQPSEENIKHRKFSYVTIYYKDVNGEGQTDKFVLFEPSKNLAIDIATQFGKNTYGEAFQKVYVYPRNYVREARKLLAAGKIIRGTGNKPTSKQEVKAEPAKANKKALSDFTSFKNAKAFTLAIWKENYPEQGTGLVDAMDWKLTEIALNTIPENSAIKENKISNDIVKYWEEQIKAGKRPPVIVKTFNALPTDLYDGSHKFLAYRNLDIKNIPALVGAFSDDDRFGFFSDKYAVNEGGKFSVKKILLSTESVSRVADFSKAKELTTWKAANKDAKSLVGQVSDVYYQVHWNDGNVVQGYVDLEPTDFFNNINDVLSDHLVTYFTNLSKHTPDGVAGQEDIDHAKKMLKNYRFWDFNTESIEGITWIVYNSLGKIDSLQISEKEAVNYINRRPEFGRDKMSYERMSTKKAHTLWDKQQKASEKESNIEPAEPVNKYTPVPDDGFTWVVYDSNGKIDSLHNSDVEAIKYINRRPAFSRAKMRHEEMSTKAAYELWDRQKANAENETIKTSKTPIQKILLTPIFELGGKETQGTIKTFHSWEKANAFVQRAISDKRTYLEYLIEWVDGQTINGRMDLVLLSFDSLTEYVKDYLTSITKGKLLSANSPKEINEAKVLLANYLFEDTAKTTSTAPKKLSVKDKLGILTEFGKFHEKRKSEFPEVEIEEHELPIQFASWLRVNHPELLEQKDSIWKEYETVKNITNPDPNEKQIPEKDYRLFFIRFTEYAEKEIDNEADRITLKAFTDWLEKNYANINQADKEGLTKYYADFIKSLEKGRKKIENLSKPKKQQPYSGNYNKMLKLAPNLLEHLKQGYTHGLSSKGAESGNMDVSLNVLYKDSKGAYIIALSHFYKEQGELKTDLDMEVRIDPHLQMVEALTYQDGLGIFQKVYIEQDGKMMVNTKLKKQLNTFLRTWLANILDAKHKIVWSEDSKESPEFEEELQTEKQEDIPVDLSEIKVNVQEFVRKFIEVLTDIEIDADDDSQDETLIATSRLELEDAIELDDAKLVEEVKRVIEEINDFGIENPTTKKEVNKAIRIVEKALKLKASKPKKKNQHELNKDIELFIAGKELTKDEYTSEDKEYISQYSGSGGLAKKGAAGKGLLYEYYTSDEIVKLMWGLAKKYGYTDGAVLEPACGTGNFLKYVPAGAKAKGYEINPTAKRIAEILYPGISIKGDPFESLFFKGNVHLKDDFDKSQLFDLVIGNPPYGDFSGRYAGMGEKKWTKATKYEEYFITRGLDLLKPGGLLIYIIPSSFLKTGLNKVKEKIAEKSEPLVDAYQLPTGMFTTTDIGTDIIVLKRK